MTRLYALIAAGLAVAAIGGTLGFILLNDRGDRFAQCNVLQVAGGDVMGGPFQMISETGAAVTEADIVTGPTLIYFGYTFCPDVCPFDAVRNAEVVDILAQRGQSVRPVFVSVDHERDTPEVLTEFTDYMHEDMVGLTGTPEQIASMAKNYRVYYQKRDPDQEFFLYDHTAWTYLVTPEDAFVTAFARQLSSDQMADQLSCVLKLI